MTFCDISKFVVQVHCFEFPDDEREGWTEVVVPPCDDEKFQRMCQWLTDHAPDDWAFGFRVYGWSYKIKDPDVAFQFKMTFR